MSRPPSRLANPLLWLSTLTIGLMAGFFYAFAVLVMPALSRVDDKTFVITMQRINEGVQTGGFAFGFFGAFVFTTAAAIVQAKMGRRAAARWIIAAAILYLVALAVTFGGNIPLNNKLAAAGDPAQILDFAAARASFDEGAWVGLNAVRLVASSLALLALVPALALTKRAETPQVR
ncbi:MAG: DUF1772 domain-containing protein [Kibdelosporangium sp.]